MAVAIVSIGPARGAERGDLLEDFRPSQVESAHGKVSEVAFSTRLVVLDPGVLTFHSVRAVKELRLAEPVWVIGYKTEIFDPENQAPRSNYLCHTFFGDQPVIQRKHQHEHQELRALYSDSFTQELRLPDGFAIRLTPDDNLQWMPMFNNRDEDLARVGMKVTLTLIRDRNIEKPLRPLFSTLRSVKIPHLYFVPSGRHQQETTFEFPSDVTIHFMGAHLHPYGVSVELSNLSRSEEVWKGMRHLNNSGETVGMDTYSSTEGYEVRAGETLRITSTYDNTTDQPIDAMAALFVFYAPK
jgi:hypothetical protein